MGTNGFILVPNFPTAAQGTRVAQILYEGAVFLMPFTPSLSNIALRLTAATAPCTLSVALYQKAPTGAVSLFRLAVHGSVVVGGNGAQDVLVPVNIPEFKLSEGRVIWLWGKSSVGGSVTMRVYGGQNYDSLSQNVPAGAYPVTFQTLLPAALGPPETLDLNAQIASNLSLAPVARLL